MRAIKRLRNESFRILAQEVSNVKYNITLQLVARSFYAVLLVIVMVVVSIVKVVVVAVLVDVAAVGGIVGAVVVAVVLAVVVLVRILVVVVVVVVVIVVVVIAVNCWSATHGGHQTTSERIFPNLGPRGFRCKI